MLVERDQSDISHALFLHDLNGQLCSFPRTRELLELGIDNEDSEHENDEDTSQSKSKQGQEMPASEMAAASGVPSRPLDCTVFCLCGDFSSLSFSLHILLLCIS